MGGKRNDISGNDSSTSSKCGTRKWLYVSNLSFSFVLCCIEPGFNTTDFVYLIVSNESIGFILTDCALEAAVLKFECFSSAGSR